MPDCVDRTCAQYNDDLVVHEDAAMVLMDTQIQLGTIGLNSTKVDRTSGIPELPGVANRCMSNSAAVSVPTPAAAAWFFGGKERGCTSAMYLHF